MRYFAFPVNEQTASLIYQLGVFDDHVPNECLETPHTYVFGIGLSRTSTHIVEDSEFENMYKTNGSFEIKLVSEI